MNSVKPEVMDQSVNQPSLTNDSSVSSEIKKPKRKIGLIIISGITLLALSLSTFFSISNQNENEVTQSPTSKEVTTSKSPKAQIIADATTTNFKSDYL